MKALPVVRYFEKHPHIEVRAAKPHFVVLDDWKDLLVGNRIGVPDDQELLPVFHEQGNVLAEEREGRVGDHDIRHFHEFDALGATEVAASREACASVGVPFQKELDVFDAGRAITVDVLYFLDLDGDRPGLLALVIALVVLTKRELCAGDWGAIVAGGDKLFQPELVEIGSEILEEVALEGVVTVAVDDPPAEGIGIKFEVSFHLFLDVDVLSVKLVLLGHLRGTKALIHRLAFRLRHSLSFLHQVSPNL